VKFGKRATVKSLNLLCGGVDAVAYRPAVVKATLRLPRWWNCNLARLSVRLDERWETGCWGCWYPGGLCEACGRRAAWLVVSDSPFCDDEERWEPRHRAVEVCGWCRLEGQIVSDAELDAALEAAKARSVSYRWRP
jgi:hypothetical protein